MTTEPPLRAALTRLKAFRQSWNPEDIIDEESGLTAADLDEIISFVGDFPSSD